MQHLYLAPSATVTCITRHASQTVVAVLGYSSRLKASVERGNGRRPSLQRATVSKALKIRRRGRGTRSFTEPAEGDLDSHACVMERPPGLRRMVHAPGLPCGAGTHTPTGTRGVLPGAYSRMQDGFGCHVPLLKMAASHKQRRSGPVQLQDTTSAAERM